MCTSGFPDVPDVPDLLRETNLAERPTRHLAYRPALPNNHIFAFGALTLLFGRQKEHPACNRI